MLSFLNRNDGQKKEDNTFISVNEGLKRLYRSKILPLEEHYMFKDFHSPLLEDADFDAKPMILLVGQYSTGKTTFIKYLLEQDFPGIRIGPEPTTDKFIIVMHGEQETVTPGNALVVDPKKHFRALAKFGGCFLNRLQCSTVKSKVLESITIIDTPGILSGEKQRVDRGYDFTGVLEWFAERVDRIILLFDAHKLDISDEFRRSIEALRGQDDKIRIVLNKADMVDHQQLMRIYGALMWSLGKVFNTPEVSRVYIGSFWDQRLNYDANRKLFEAEEQDLFSDLQSLPRNAALRKLNDLIKRARLAKVHAYVISALKKEMPALYGKSNKKKDLIKHLSNIYASIAKEHSIAEGDFPPLQEMQEKLLDHDFSKFNPLNKKLVDSIDKMLKEDISRLMSQIPQNYVIDLHELMLRLRSDREKEKNFLNTFGSTSIHQQVTSGTLIHHGIDPQHIPEQISKPKEETSVKGGAFEGQEESPFGFGRGEGIDEGAFDPNWVVARDKARYDEIFQKLRPQEGKVSGCVAKLELTKSKLPNSVLSKVWKLADVDKDGCLDSDEFALAMHLINVKLEGHDLPGELPAHLIPPSKRMGEQNEMINGWHGYSKETIEA